MTNGRQKGSRGERDVAHIIKEWWDSHEPSAQFIRTPLSGGWAHDTKAAAHFRASGDLMTTSPDFPFCVEVKWREGWSVDRFLDGRPTAAWAWWEQTIRAAVKQNETPMMWMRRNRIPKQTTAFPWLVLIPADYAEERDLERPDVRWTAPQLALNGVAYGTILPVAYDYTRFVKMNPRRMVERYKGQL